MPFEIIVDDIYNLKIGAFVRQSIPYKMNMPQSATLHYAEEYRKRMERYNKMSHKLSGNNPEAMWWLRHKADSIIYVTMFYWDDDTIRNRRKLGECYDLILDCAQTHQVESLAIPLLGTDRFGCPIHIAGGIAIRSINDWISKRNSSMKVYLVISLNEKDRFYDLADQSQNIFLSYDNKMYSFEKTFTTKNCYSISVEQEEAEPALLKQEVSPQEKFHAYLKRIENESQIAKLMDCSASTVNRIRNKRYQRAPHKSTVIMLAIALGLSKEERLEFVNCVYPPYPFDERDKLIEQLLQQGYTTIKELNEEIEEKNPEWILVHKSKGDTLPKTNKKKNKKEYEFNR